MRDQTISIFRKFAQGVADGTGSPWAFFGALAVVLAWGATGPHYHYSDTWELVINTGTTIITFLMLFIFQYTQKREARAQHLKLDELLRAVKEASNFFIGAEDMSDEAMLEARDTLRRVREALRKETDNVR